MNVSVIPAAKMLPASTLRVATNVPANRDLLAILSLPAQTLMNARLRVILADRMLFVGIQILALSASVLQGLVETEMLPAKLQKSEHSVNPILTVRIMLFARKANVSVDQASPLLELSALMLTNVEALRAFVVQMLSVEIHLEASHVHVLHLSLAARPASPAQVHKEAP